MPDQSGEDSQVVRIRELNQLAWDNRIRDSEAALGWSSEAVQLARRVNDARGLAWGLVTQGFGYARKAAFEAARGCLQEARLLFESLEDLKGLAAAHEYTGIVERNLGDLAAALRSIFTGLRFSREASFTELEITNLYQLGVTYRQLAEYEKALEYLFQSLQLCQSVRHTLLEGYCLNVIGSIYVETGEYEQALLYFKQALPLRQRFGDKWGEAGSLDNIGYCYLKLQQFDQAVETCHRSMEISLNAGDRKGQANSMIHLAEAYHRLADESSALALGHQSLAIREEVGDVRGQVEALMLLARISADDETGVPGNLAEALALAHEIKALDLVGKIHFMLHEYFKEQGRFEESLDQFQRHYEIERVLHKDAIAQKIGNLENSRKAEEFQKEAEAMRERNDELERLNGEIEAQKTKLEKALVELQATQKQLVQAEKMASLGELTAGIAHEIQNPLNFVNNFSEVSIELLSELHDEVERGNPGEVISIARDVQQNLEKIHQHGRRADAIVKSMLQHSRTTSSQQEPANINALADEYLRLAYHGLRAKDKSFNATLETDFDDTIGLISIVPQDIGRVVLNLVSNSFYAVSEKAGRAPKGYDPVVALHTKRVRLPSGEDRVEIIVRDNGPGIPRPMLEKIFQPFFTTKPAGRGAGLGLSLSYDIIKAHGGELTVESKEGEYAMFKILLPVNNPAPGM